MCKKEYSLLQEYSQNWSKKDVTGIDQKRGLFIYERWAQFTKYVSQPNAIKQLSHYGGYIFFVPHFSTNFPFDIDFELARKYRSLKFLKKFLGSFGEYQKEEKISPKTMKNAFKEKYFQKRISAPILGRSIIFSSFQTTIILKFNA